MIRSSWIKYIFVILILGSLGFVFPHEAKAEETQDCDFALEVTEANFCVIQGKVYDMDVTLTPILGSCQGSTTLAMSGLPRGVTHKILPASGMKLAKGVGRATVRMDTAGLSLTERSTIPLTLTATHEGTVQTESVDMAFDLPSFDFSIQPETSRLRLFQDETVPVPVRVKLLGAACQEPPLVRLSLQRSTSPLSFAVTHQFEPDSVVPPEETTVLFTAASVPEIGSLKTTLIGCCTSDKKERAAEIILEILPPLPDALPKEDESVESLRQEDPQYEDLVDQDEPVKVESLDNILTDLKLSPTLKDEAQKSVEDEAKKGYRAVKEEEIQTLQRSHERTAPLYEVVQMLAFEPFPRDKTSFATLHPEGVYTAGSLREGKWTAVVHLFTTEDGRWIELTEEDIVLSGGMENLIAKEGVELSIHGFPTTIVVQQSPNGQALSRLSWQTPTRAYNLRMEGNVKTDPRKKAFFLDLAKSLPAS